MKKVEKLLILFIAVVGYFFLVFIQLGLVDELLKSLHLRIIIVINKVVFLIVSWFYIKAILNKLNLDDSKFKPNIKFSDIYYFLFGGAIPLVLSAASLFIASIIFKEFDYQLIISTLTIKHFFEALVTAFNEELLFRALIFYSLYRITGKLFFSAFLSSIFFVFMHFEMIEEDIAYLYISNVLIGSLLLSYIYFLTKSIWSSIGLHALNNTIENVFDFTYEDNFNKVLYLSAYTILLILIFLLFVYIQRKKCCRLFE
ncbi:MAG TPA: type II CAAX endopeptidase family protein [Bacteroidales bacterium]|nr:type II CAAX endopeptidase family protein [Bacteroidales bacterium]